MNMDKKEHLELFKRYYYEHGEEIDDDIKKTENIKEEVKKYCEVNRIVSKHKNIESYMSEHYNAGKSNSIEDDKYFNILREYSKKVRQLEKTKNELAKKDEVKKKIKEWESYGKFDTNDQQNSNKNEEIYYCDKCLEEKSGRYLFHKTKNDGYKFCSAECYKNYYGEHCSKCVNENKNFKKYLNVVQDGDNTYCRAYYYIVKQEEKDQEEPKITVHCRFCNAECPQHL